MQIKMSMGCYYATQAQVGSGLCELPREFPEARIIELRYILEDRSSTLFFSKISKTRFKGRLENEDSGKPIFLEV